MFKRLAILSALLAFPLTASAQPIEVIPTTADGMVPGTGITYTLTATGMAREIWAPGMSDMGTWEWLNGFPEFVSIGTQTLTVDFSAPVQINRIVLGVNSAGIGPFTLTLSGGSATTSDFDVMDGLTVVGGAAPALYDGATGEFSFTGGDQSLMIGSTSTNTITQFSITGDNGGDGYTLFYGPTAVAPVSAVDEIPTLGEMGIATLVLLLAGAAVLVLRRA